jgi:hypothetical protein
MSQLQELPDDLVLFFLLKHFSLPDVKALRQTSHSLNKSYEDYDVNKSVQTLLASLATDSRLGPYQRLIKLKELERLLPITKSPQTKKLLLPVAPTPETIQRALSTFGSYTQKILALGTHRNDDETYLYFKKYLDPQTVSEYLNPQTNPKNPQKNSKKQQKLLDLSVVLLPYVKMALDTKIASMFEPLDDFESFARAKASTLNISYERLMMSKFAVRQNGGGKINSRVEALQYATQDVVQMLLALLGIAAEFGVDYRDRVTAAFADWARRILSMLGGAVRTPAERAAEGQQLQDLLMNLESFKNPKSSDFPTVMLYAIEQLNTRHALLMQQLQPDNQPLQGGRRRRAAGGGRRVKAPTRTTRRKAKAPAAAAGAGRRRVTPRLQDAQTAQKKDVRSNKRAATRVTTTAAARSSAPRAGSKSPPRRA